MGAPISRFRRLRRKAPQIIAAAIIMALVVYVLFEVTEDFLIQGTARTSGPLVSALLDLTRTVRSTVHSWGYPGIFGLMALEASSLPIPSELVLPFSGYLISLGELNFLLTVIVATIAAIVGSLVDYYIGLKGVEMLTKRRVLGRAVFSVDQLTYAGEWFSKYGSAMVFLGRLIPGIRTLISFPAGAAKMPLAKFVAYTTAGCLLWNAVLIYVGYYLGVNWTAVAGVSHYLILGVIAALLAAFALYVAMKRRKRKKTKAGKLA